MGRRRRGTALVVVAGMLLAGCVDEAFVDASRDAGVDPWALLSPQMPVGTPADVTLDTLASRWRLSGAQEPFHGVRHEGGDRLRYDMYFPRDGEIQGPHEARFVVLQDGPEASLVYGPTDDQTAQDVESIPTTHQVSLVGRAGQREQWAPPREIYFECRGDHACAPEHLHHHLRTPPRMPLPVETGSSWIESLGRSPAGLGHLLLPGTYEWRAVGWVEPFAPWWEEIFVIVGYGSSEMVDGLFVDLGVTMGFTRDGVPALESVTRSAVYVWVDDVPIRVRELPRDHAIPLRHSIGNTESQLAWILVDRSPGSIDAAAVGRVLAKHADFGTPRELIRLEDTVAARVAYDWWIGLQEPWEFFETRRLVVEQGGEVVATLGDEAVRFPRPGVYHLNATRLDPQGQEIRTEHLRVAVDDAGAADLDCFPDPTGCSLQVALSPGVERITVAGRGGIDVGPVELVVRDAGGKAVASFPWESVREGVFLGNLTIHTAEDWTFAIEADTGTPPYTPRTLEWTIEAYR